MNLKRSKSQVPPSWLAPTLLNEQGNNLQQNPSINCLQRSARDIDIECSLMSPSGVDTINLQLERWATQNRFEKSGQ